MRNDLDPKVAAILRCPHCGRDLETCSDGRFFCRPDNDHFDWTESGSLDLRPRKPIHIELPFTIAPSTQGTEIQCHEDMPFNPKPDIDFGDTPVPIHLSKQMMSYFPRAAGKDSLMLDLGCGDTRHRQVCEKAGFSYVGADYNNPKAPFLADAHVLPFRDESFEFVLSIAVLEHIQFPFVMIREANRVLKSGGVFIGSVAFLEPYHNNSIYHHSRLGLLNTLQYGGFNIKQIAASTTWSVFPALAGLATTLFPRVPKFISRNIIMFPHKLWHSWWKLGRLLKPNNPLKRRADYVTGAFYFIATKQAT